MAEGAGVALVNAAQAVYAAARTHKRSEIAHRRQARALMGEFHRLQRECQRLGITVEITETPRRASE
jgi:hypothetical protein